MRVVDVMTAFPALLFAIFLDHGMGRRLEKVILCLLDKLGIGRHTPGTRQFLTLREKEFVGAARAIAQQKPCHRPAQFAQRQ